MICLSVRCIYPPCFSRSMGPVIQDVLGFFDSVSLGTLQSLIGAQEPDQVEKLIVDMILKGKLKDFRIDDGYVLKITKEPVLANVLKKLQTLDAN